jgi:hypothetical protein
VDAQSYWYVPSEHDPATENDNAVYMLQGGDFLQLDVTGGTALCKMLYQTVSSPRILSARALFKKFRVCFLTQQHRASECQVQQKNLLACRSLPDFYPAGARYAAAEMQAFRPMTPEIIKAITHELSLDDVKNDPGWLDEATVLVTNNIDKAVLTSCATRLYAKRNNEFLFKWRRQTKTELPVELQHLVYDEDSHPQLFAYFAKGVSAQILDNNNGNVGWSIANGTPCKMHSLAWESQSKTDFVMHLIEQARHARAVEVELPFPPDFVNVTLPQTSERYGTGVNWPDELNLETQCGLTIDGTRTQKESVIIPIGLMSPKSRKSTVRLGYGVLDTPRDIEFVQHAVDIALVMTVWKAQGSTLKRVVLNLEPSRKSAPAWGFEHLYVGMSRVTAAKHLRCFPLTGAFRTSRLHNLRPSIHTTKWRLDHQADH